MKRNAFPTTCTTCATKVPAGHGALVKRSGRWIADCAISTGGVSGSRAYAARCDCGRPTCGGCDDTYDAMKDRLAEAGYVSNWDRGY